MNRVNHALNSLRLKATTPSHSPSQLTGITLRRCHRKGCLPEYSKSLHLTSAVRQGCNLPHSSLVQESDIGRITSVNQDTLNLRRQRQKTHELADPGTRNPFSGSEYCLVQSGIGLNEFLPFQGLSYGMICLYGHRTCEAFHPMDQLMVHVGIAEWGGYERRCSIPADWHPKHDGYVPDSS